MLVAEGAFAQIDQIVDAAGLAGPIAGTIDWGDGTTSPATIAGNNAPGNNSPGNNPPGNVSIRFDYSLDTAGFFDDPVRREVLQSAADALTDALVDDLSAVEIDAPQLQWRPRVFHPSLGGSDPAATQQFEIGLNPRVNRGEIVIYVGSRPFAGSVIGIGGAGANAYSVPQFSAPSQQELDRILAAIDRDIVELETRGQSGANGSVRTDVAPSFGSIAFDRDPGRFYFGVGEIGPNQTDFFAAAQHEIAHVLGYGEEFVGVTSSWERLTVGSSFSGAASTAVYRDGGGSGNVPLNGGHHWAASVRDDLGIETILTAGLIGGVRNRFSELDYAALDDIGWQVTTSSTTVTGSHRYGDDGQFTPVLNLRGSGGGQATLPLDPIMVTNVSPTVTPIQTPIAVAGQPLTIDVASYTDPGFGNALATPPSNETFTATIDWGDGQTSQITPRVTSGGAAGVESSGVVSASHTFDRAGQYDISTAVTDDDGATRSVSTTIEVLRSMPFQNTDNPLDVNVDGMITPLDALRVINRLRALDSGDDGQLDPNVARPDDTNLFDVDGDGFVRPIDALLVINALRQQSFEPEPPVGLMRPIDFIRDRDRVFADW